MASEPLSLRIPDPDDDDDDDQPARGGRGPGSGWVEGGGEGGVLRAERAWECESKVEYCAAWHPTRNEMWLKVRMCAGNRGGNGPAGALAHETGAGSLTPQSRRASAAAAREPA